MGPLPRDLAQATRLAIETRWPHAVLSDFSRGDTLRAAFQRSLRSFTIATRMDSAERLAALAPNRPSGLELVCRNYELSMALLQLPNYDIQLGLDCAATSDRETAPSAIHVVLPAVLAGALWPFSLAAMLLPGAGRRLAGMPGRRWLRRYSLADRPILLRCLPAVLAHAGLLCLAMLATTCLFIALPAAVAPSAWAAVLLHASWAAPLLEPMASVGSAFAGSLLAVFGLVYAARLWLAGGWDESRS
jgi:hypothetical protein